MAARCCRWSATRRRRLRQRRRRRPPAAHRRSTAARRRSPTTRANGSSNSPPIAATGAVAASVGKMRARRRQDGEVREFGPHQSTVADLDFSKDGSRIACAHYGGITVWSIGQVDPAAAPLRLARQPRGAEVEHRRQVHRHRHAGKRHPCLAHGPGHRHAHAGLSRQGEVAVVDRRCALPLHLLAAGVHRLAVLRQGPRRQAAAAVRRGRRGPPHRRGRPSRRRVRGRRLRFRASCSSATSRPAARWC